MFFFRKSLKHYGCKRFSLQRLISCYREQKKKWNWKLKCNVMTEGFKEFIHEMKKWENSPSYNE